MNEHPQATSQALGAADRQVLMVFVALALAYWLVLTVPGWSLPLAWMAMLKAAPMLLAAAWLWQRLPRRHGLPLALGFAAAAAGDAFLSVDRHALLTQALACFLVTQLAYAAAFFRLPAGRHAMLAALPPLAIGLGGFALLLPGLGAMFWPVAVYVAALMLMVTGAARVGAAPGMVYAGALLFLVADLLIGINRFVQPFAGSTPLIVAIYTSGQGLIFVGLLRALRRRS